jgi:hypothetical protein
MCLLDDQPNLLFFAGNIVHKIKLIRIGLFLLDGLLVVQPLIGEKRHDCIVKWLYIITSGTSRIENKKVHPRVV